MKRFSLLELLHPDGKASTSFTLGSNCPESLFPEASTESDQKIALFVVAPSEEECRSEGWLEGAVKLVHQRLSDEGVCYVLVPPPGRRQMIRMFARVDLVIDSSFWHFPDCTSSHYLIPLQHAPAQFAVEKIISAPPWKRTLAREMFRYSVAHKFLSGFWNSTGMSVRRPGARPLFQWLFQREDHGISRRTAIIRRSWRGLHGSNILYCFTERDELPSMIVKIASAEASLALLEREAEVLKTLGPGARRAGIQIPEILPKEDNNQQSALFLTPLRGRPASDLLSSNPALLSPIITKMVGWLERWHIATVNVQRLEGGRLEQDIFTPIEELTPFLPNAEEYRDWLTSRVQAATGISLPFVATHNDLTMANVLMAEHNHLGVVDWETGTEESWPLVDFYYAVTDAIRIVEGHTQWVEAVKNWYQPDGRYTQEVCCWEERLRSAIGVSADWAELCFHACWLHHASNEHRASRPGDPRPFLQIVQWLALNCSKSNENRN